MVIVPSFATTLRDEQEFMIIDCLNQPALTIGYLYELYLLTDQNSDDCECRLGTVNVGALEGRASKCTVGQVGAYARLQVLQQDTNKNGSKFRQYWYWYLMTLASHHQHANNSSLAS